MLKCTQAALYLVRSGIVFEAGVMLGQFCYRWDDLAIDDFHRCDPMDGVDAKDEVLDADAGQSAAQRDQLGGLRRSGYLTQHCALNRVVVVAHRVAVAPEHLKRASNLARAAIDEQI